jgi:hypothetical protein
MKLLDLIIDALKSAHHTNDTGVMGLTKSRLDVALAAARELKALKPVGEFMIAADINGKNCYIHVEDKDTFTFTLYALDEVKHDL